MSIFPTQLDRLESRVFTVVFGLLEMPKTVDTIAVISTFHSVVYLSNLNPMDFSTKNGPT